MISKIDDEKYTYVTRLHLIHKFIMFWYCWHRCHLVFRASFIVFSKESFSKQLSKWISFLKKMQVCLSHLNLKQILIDSCIQFLYFFSMRLMIVNVINFSSSSSSSFFFYHLTDASEKEKKDEFVFYIVSKLECMREMMTWIYIYKLFFFIFISSSFFFFDENETEAELSWNIEERWRSKA